MLGGAAAFAVTPARKFFFPPLGGWTFARPASGLLTFAQVKNDFLYLDFAIAHGPILALGDVRLDGLPVNQLRGVLSAQHGEAERLIQEAESEFRMPAGVSHVAFKISRAGYEDQPKPYDPFVCRALVRPATAYNELLRMLP